MIFNEMLRHSDFLTMAAHTTGRFDARYQPHRIDFEHPGTGLQALQQPFRRRDPGRRFGKLAAARANIPSGDQPKINSGSPTYPLDMFAALTPDRKFSPLPW